MIVDPATVPLRAGDAGYHVIVETPRGSANKLKYEPELRAFMWSRPLIAGLVYPYDWGFFPGTLAPDGDPLDAMVLADAPTYPGIVIPCRPLAVIDLEQNRKGRPGRERNDRVLVVPLKAPRSDGLRDLADLPARVRSELEQFFLAATRFEGKDAKILGWRGADDARTLIEQAASK